MDCLFEIGGRQLLVEGAPWSVGTVPPNFRPFLRDCEVVADGAIRLTVLAPGNAASCRLPQSAPLSESFNDLGRAAIHRIPSGWSIVLTPCPGEAPRVMEIDAALTSATLWLHGDADPFADFVIDSMTRIFFSQAVALTGALMVHASVVMCSDDGKAYMFMGRSGTGKSTHSRLWLDTFADCSLLNDDCPLIIPGPAAGRYTVCGTPWSGKTHCWRDASLPLGGIARLRQAPANSFRPLSGVEAFVAFIPGMSVMTADSALYSLASSTALDLTAAVPVGILSCLPDADAARLCRRSLEAMQPNQCNQSK